MKKLFIILLLNLGITYLHGQDYYMYINGEKHVYKVSEIKILIKSEIIDSLSLINTIQKTSVNNLKNINKINDQLSMAEMHNLRKGNSVEVHKLLNSQENIIYTSPVFLDELGNEIGGITNQILIRLRSIDDYSLLIESIMPYNIKSIDLCEFDNRIFLLT